MYIHQILYVRHDSHHHHVTDVATDTGPDSPDRVWPVSEVRAAITEGAVFYTAGERHTAFIHRSSCACGVDTVTSDSDATPGIALAHLDKRLQQDGQ